MLRRVLDNGDGGWLDLDNARKGMFCSNLLASAPAEICEEVRSTQTLPKG